MAEPVSMVFACISVAEKVLSFLFKYLGAIKEVIPLVELVQGITDILEQYRKMVELDHGTLSPIVRHLTSCESRLKSLDESLTSYKRLASHDAPKAKGMTILWENRSVAKGTWVAWGKEDALYHFKALESSKKNLSMSLSACA